MPRSVSTSRYSDDRPREWASIDTQARELALIANVASVEAAQAVTYVATCGWWKDALRRTE